MMRWLFDRLWHPSGRHTWLRPLVLWLARHTDQRAPGGTRYRTHAQLRRAAKKVKISADPHERYNRWKALDRRFELLNDAELAEHYRLNLELGNKGVLKR